MEVPQTIKQEKNEYDETEPDVNFQTNVLDLDSTEIELKSIKIEPHLYVSKPNSLDQKCNLSEEAKMIGTNDKSVFDCLLNEISKQKGSEIKVKGSEEMGKTEKNEDIEVKWEIENKELNAKDEIKVEDEEQRNVSTLVLRQQQRKTHSASGSKKTTQSLKYPYSDEVNKFICDQCDYQTIYKAHIKRHIIQHQNPDEIGVYKCDQCDYQTVHRRYLKKHCLKHEKSVQVDLNKCDQCDYQTVYKHDLKRHTLITP